MSRIVDIRRDDPERRIKAVLTSLDELGTDRMMAENFANREVESGDLEGEFKAYVLPSRGRFGPTGQGAAFLGYAVIGTIVSGQEGTLVAINAGRDLDDRLEVVGSAPEAVLDKIAKRLRMSEGSQKLVYKARPLNGIWATAPYLHNGSVRTMRQLLLPTAQRQTTFRVGSREFDPDDMGFEDAGGYPFDTTLLGNSNAGHEYGADELAADDATLNALLEYLKTL